MEKNLFDKNHGEKLIVAPLNLSPVPLSSMRGGGFTEVKYDDPVVQNESINNYQMCKSARELLAECDQLIRESDMFLDI
jgi:hypothetical protein